MSLDNIMKCWTRKKKAGGNYTNCVGSNKGAVKKQTTQTLLAKVSAPSPPPKKTNEWVLNGNVVSSGTGLNRVSYDVFGKLPSWFKKPKK